MFFDEKKKGGGFVGHMDDGGSVADTYEDDGGNHLEAIADELIEAVHARDKAGVVEALKALMICIQSEDMEQDSRGS